MRIPHPLHYAIIGRTKGVFPKVVLGFRKFGYEGLGEMFEGDSADRCAKKFFAPVDGGPSGGTRVCRSGSKEPHGVTGNSF
jgi:hypothetical protein